MTAEDVGAFVEINEYKIMVCPEIITTLKYILVKPIILQVIYRIDLTLLKSILRLYKLKIFRHVEV